MTLFGHLGAMKGSVMPRFLSAFMVCLIFVTSASGGVVVNEIFYHAPDDLDDVQFIELHNTGAQAVDLAGWKLARAVQYTFPATSQIEGGGYLVLCKNLSQFRKYY